VIRKTNIHLRNAKRAALIAGLLACTGCAGGGGPSLASLNPFGKADPSASNVSDGTASPGITSAVASTAKGARGQVSSMSAAVKSAYSKTTDGITGIFTGGKEDLVDGTGKPIPQDDPLRLDNKPKSIGPEVFVANGQLWETSGNLDKAMENYSKALESEPTNAPALASVARLKFRQGLFDESANYFQRAVATAPNDASLYNDWGLTQSKQGKHADAAQTIQKALAISPGTSRYANNLASVQFSAGQSDKALATLQQHNQPAVAHFNMAYLEFNQGNYDRARLQLAEAIKFEPQANEDTAVRRAVDRSRELLAKLDGPATQMATVAQAIPQAYDVAKQLQQTAKQVMPAGNTTLGPSGTAAGPSSPSPGTTIDVAKATAGPPQASVAPDGVAAPDGTAAPATSNATNVAAQPAPAPSTAPNASGFTLPPDFMTEPAAQTAELPGTGEMTR